MSATAIAWFRRDLRLDDNAALIEAAEDGRPVVPVYVHDAERAGSAADWWLHHSLAALSRALDKRGAPLLILRGKSSEVLPKLAALVEAGSIHYTRGYTPAARSEQEAVAETVGDDAIAHDSYYLHRPGTVLTAEETPYRVFTPFWKSCVSRPEHGRPAAAPETLRSCSSATLKKVKAELPVTSLDDIGLLPTSPDWAGGLRDTWTPGEDGAHARLDAFAESAGRYASRRDFPGEDATSKLSPHLHYGEISPRQVWHRLHDNVLAGEGARGAEAFLRQLYWRDFCGHLLFHFPEMPSKPLRDEFESFGWKDDTDALNAWQRGQTGIPIVDAGMRELWTTGWMHNRVRMIVASFLVKNLLVPWQHGAEWFLDTLVDADLANNSAGWQWVAGCGTDAAPYFRIFNPVLQSRKFDPGGDYLRTWLPELKRLPDRDLHEPWAATDTTLRDANVELGKHYPKPIADLADTRQRALDAYQAMRSLLQSPAASPGSSAG